MELYRTYSDYLKEKFGEKVYKIPVAIPVTCPNRDGLFSDEGCIFCGPIGADYEGHGAETPIKTQLASRISHVGPKYKAKKFIAYFLNFTATYAPVEEFRAWMMEAASRADVVGISVSTRPDALADPYLDVLADVRDRFGTDITIELGLQSSNLHTLARLNRCHGVAAYVDAALACGRYKFGLCTHIIADLPFDEESDVIEAAKLLSVLPVTEVKLHSLFVVKGTALHQMIERGEMFLLPPEIYVKRCALFLSHLRGDIAVGRLTGRAAGKTILSVNGGKPWWDVEKDIKVWMQENDLYQGKDWEAPRTAAVRQWIK